MFKNIKFDHLSISIFIMIAIINLDFTAMSILFNDLQLLYDTTLEETQKIVSLYLVFAASFFIVSGKLIDTYSPAKVYTLGIIIFCFSIPIVLFNTSLEAVYIARCLQGMSYPFIFNSGVILLNTLYPPENKISGVTLIIFISSLMQILGPGIAGILIELQGWRAIFYFTGLATTLSVFLLFLTNPQNIPFVKSSTAKFDLQGCLLFLLFCGLTSSPIFYNMGYDKITITLILAWCCLFFIYGPYHKKNPFFDISLLKDKYFFSIVLLRFFSNICWSILILYIPTYLQQKYSFTVYEAGIFILITSSIAIVWVLLSDHITKKWGAYRTLLFPTICLMTLHLIMLSIGKSPSPIILVILLIIYGFTGLITPTLTKSCLNYIEDKRKGQGMGIYYTLSLLSMGTGSILLGKLSLILEYFPFIGNFWNIISLICIFLYAISILTLVLTNRGYGEVMTMPEADVRKK